MSSSRYRQALTILERWPKDPTKGEHRDIAVLLRKRIAESFRQGDTTVISDPEKCDRMLKSLDNISSNKLKNEHKLLVPVRVGALGFEYDVIHESLSDDMLQQLEIQNFDKKAKAKQSFLSKLFGKKTDDGDKKVVA